MSNCRYIQSLIDKADQPARLPLEATSHMTSCAPCQTFADERAQLRNLLGAMPRVSTPASYDVRLKARLAEAKAPRSFAWFSPAGYQRFAAAAVLVIAVFIAQYNGLLSGTNNSTNISQTDAVAPSSGEKEAGSASASIDKTPEAVMPPPAVSRTPVVIVNGGRVAAVSARYPGDRRRGVQATPASYTPASAEAEDINEPIRFMVKSENSTTSEEWLRVSLGAQQRRQKSRPSKPPVTVAAVSF